MPDAFDLQRFVEAQNPVYERVVAELRAGRKRSHWMWFVFPQIHGLGSSPMANKFAIASRAEAAAYLAHPVLGSRLRECTRLVNQIGGDIDAVFGYPDTWKFRSSMTLFDAVAGDETEFAEALQRYFGGEKDASTLARL